MAVLEKRRALGFAACAMASSLLGLRIFLRQDCAGGDELRAHGAVPVSVCDGGAAAAAGDASTGAESREWGMLAAAAFLGVPVQFLIQFYGLSLTTVSHASLMVGTMPVILAVGPQLFAHERMDRDWLVCAGRLRRQEPALIALGGASCIGAGRALRWTGDLLVVVSLADRAVLDSDLNKRADGAALA